MGMCMRATPHLTAEQKGVSTLDAGARRTLVRDNVAEMLGCVRPELVGQTALE
jgi:hypothetical protein